MSLLLNHYEKYGVMPDRETILGNQSLAMEFFTVNDSGEYLIGAIKEDKLFNDTVAILKTLGDILVDDSVKAVEYLHSVMPQLTKQTQVEGTDITKDQSRLATIENKKAGKSQVIKTGLKELDDIIYGWLPGEELATVVARTGQGKNLVVITIYGCCLETG